MILAQCSWGLLHDLFPSKRAARDVSVKRANQMTSLWYLDIRNILWSDPYSESSFLCGIESGIESGIKNES